MLNEIKKYIYQLIHTTCQSKNYVLYSQYRTTYINKAKKKNIKGKIQALHALNSVSQEHLNFVEIIKNVLCRIKTIFKVYFRKF